MMPSLRVFAREIEPSGSCSRACPAHTITERKRIERRKIVFHVRPCVREQIDHDARTEAARCLQPRLIQIINEFYEFIPIAYRRTGRRKSVALARQNSDIASQKMQRNIFNVPERR